MNAYIFDVDGVLTDPQTKKITIHENIETIVTLLEKGHIISLITGRAIPWVEEHVLTFLEQEVKDSARLSHVYVSGEFGNINLFFEDGKKVDISNSNTIPQDLIERVKILGEKYKESMFFATDKTTMISFEMHDGYDLEKFKIDEEKFLKELEELMKLPEYANLELSHNIIAIDIKDKKANKQYATDKFLGWLRGNNLEPEKFFAFGDNESDLEIAREIHNQNHPVEFIFVGADETVLKQELFPIIYTTLPFEKGVREYFSKSL